MMDGETIATLISGGLVVLLIATVRGIYVLWRDRNRAQREAVKAAREEALTQARNEALIREAQATIAQKQREVEAVTAHNLRLQRRIDELVSTLQAGYREQ